MPEFTFQVSMSVGVFENEVSYDLYYRSYFSYLSKMYIEEDIKEIFGTNTEVRLSKTGRFYDKENEVYLYPTMELNEMSEFFYGFEVMVFVDSEFKNNEFDEEVRKIYETICYLNESIITPNSLLLYYNENEDNSIGYLHFYDIEKINDIDEVKSLVNKQIS